MVQSMGKAPSFTIGKVSRASAFPDTAHCTTECLGKPKNREASQATGFNHLSRYLGWLQGHRGCTGHLVAKEA